MIKNWNKINCFLRIENKKEIIFFQASDFYFFTCSLQPAKEAGLSPVKATIVQLSSNPYLSIIYFEIDP